MRGLTVIPVRDLQVGDLILTTDDRWQEVTGHVLLEQAEHELYVVTVDGNFGGVVVAGEAEVVAVR